MFEHFCVCSKCDQNPFSGCEEIGLKGNLHTGAMFIKFVCSCFFPPSQNDIKWDFIYLGVHRSRSVGCAVGRKILKSNKSSTMA